MITKSILWVARIFSMVVFGVEFDGPGRGGPPA